MPPRRLLVSAVVAGCVHRQAPPPIGTFPAVSQRADHARACAVFTDAPEPEACAAPNPRGLDPAHPLEWGAAARGSLWGGRLVCPSGASAEVVRTGSLPVTHLSVEGTPSEFPNLDPRAQLVDAWRVLCPGEPPRTWYTSLYHCGNPCPPEGFRVVPRRVLDPAFEAADRGDLDATRAAVEGWEDVELARTAVLFAAMRAGDARLVLHTLDGLSRIAPEPVERSIVRGQALIAAGALDAGIGLLEDTAARIPEDHPDRLLLLCTAASVVDATGAVIETAALRKQACGDVDGTCCEHLDR